jgi:hypothetical protein
MCEVGRSFSIAFQREFSFARLLPCKQGISLWLQFRLDSYPPLVPSPGEPVL